MRQMRNRRGEPAHRNNCQTPAEEWRQRLFVFGTSCPTFYSRSSAFLTTACANRGGATANGLPCDMGLATWDWRLRPYARSAYSAIPTATATFSESTPSSIGIRTL